MAKVVSAAQIGKIMGKATPKMIHFAKRIAEELDLPEPNYNDFDDTSEFISEWKNDYYISKDLKKRGKL